MEMEYRRLGGSGLKVSALSFGSWVTFDTQLDTDLALDCMQTAWDSGVNFFDNAESYAGGASEQIMGRALEQLAWPRHSYVLSTKFYFGIHDGVNTTSTLNRKYLMGAIDPSLERLGVDFVDLAFCHRFDPETPMEEIVWAMSDIVSSGRATYWGTSEWSAEEIRHATAIAERHHLHRPVVEQPEYNLLNRRRVEVEYDRLYDDLGLGLTTWSPLKSGLLTGKYLDGAPDGSRLALAGYEWLRDQLLDEDTIARIGRLKPIADDIDCTMSQLAVAWCVKNENVSTVITGASRPDQVAENMAALEVVDSLDDQVLSRIETALG